MILGGFLHVSSPWALLNSLDLFQSFNYFWKFFWHSNYIHVRLTELILSDKLLMLFIGFQLFCVFHFD